MAARILLALLCLLLAEPTAAAAVSVEPNPISMDATFRGTNVRVRGPAEPGARVFVVVTGERIAEKFNRKGRVGVLWASVGSVHVSRVPRLCLIASSSDSAVRVDRSVIEQNLLDLESVVARAEIEAKGASRQLMQTEYVRLKKSEGLFGNFRGAVRVKRGTGQDVFEAVLPWPHSAPPGDYRVDVVHVRDNRVVRRESTALTAKLVGLPAWISEMAFRRGTLYGVVSVVVALAVGFLMGLVFKKGGGH
jgi:hypothetical protein